MIRLFSVMYLLLISFTFSNAQKWPGQVLFHNGATNSTIKLVDTSGVTQKSWTVAGGSGYSTYLMPGGKISKTTKTTTSITGGGVHGKSQIIDWAGNIIWDWTYSSASEVIHHDHCPMPNGNILFICYDQISAADCAALGRTATANVKFEKIIEVKPTGLNTGIIVWEWRFRDHLVQTSDPTKPNYTASPINNPERFNLNYSAGTIASDFIHMNGIDYNPELDQIAFSAHFLNEWFIIDHSTTTAEAATGSGGISGKGGNFLYRWGCPANYGGGGAKNFNVLHDAHWVKKGSPRAGSIVAINNGGQTAPTNKSTIDWAKPTLNGFLYNYTAGQTLPPSTYDKRLVTAGYTSNMGNSEQYPNGNTMVCIATAGTIYEYDSMSNLLWTYSTGGSTAQAHKYSSCELDTNSIRASIDTYTVFKCSGNLTPVYVSVNTYKGTGTNTYQWSSYPGGAMGNTTQSIQVNPTTTTSYTVTVTSGNCSVTATKMVRIETTPIANAGNDTSISSGQSAKLNGNGNGTYLWMPGGQTTKSITVNPTSKTTYILKVSNGNCYATDSVIVDVFTGSLSIKPTASDTNVCDGDSITINANASGGMGPYTYTWSSVPAGFTGSAASFKVRVNNSVIYKVVVNDGINKDSGTVSIVSSTKPNINAGNDTFVISGSSITLQASGGTNYLWNTGDTSAKLTVAPNCKMAYSIISSNNNCSDTDEVIVSVIPKNVNGKKVKFAVDMRGYAVNPHGVHIMGDFQTDAGFTGGNWLACAVELFKESNDTNIYSRVLTLPAHKKYEFKFVNGMEDYEQEFVPEESRVGYNFVDNRWIYIDSLQYDTTIIGAIQFEKNAPNNKKLIRFKVDMSKEPNINSNKIHISGSFQNNNPATNILYSFVPKIYEVISYVDSINHTFKYINGNQPNNAEIVPNACATAGSRRVVASKDTVLPIVCFSACDSCPKSSTIFNSPLNCLHIHPNPAQNFVKIQLGETMSIIYVLTNQLGEVIEKGKFINQEEFTLNRNNLNSGIYYLNLILKEQHEKSYKIIFE